MIEKGENAYEKERYCTGFRYVFCNYLQLDEILILIHFLVGEPLC